MQTADFPPERRVKNMAVGEAGATRAYRELCVVLYDGQPADRPAHESTCTQSRGRRQRRTATERQKHKPPASPAPPLLHVCLYDMYSPDDSV